ncbi:hypothetical protein HanOQP8_Chr17g0681661 [Helianthus annuus]|nr:hypothetical protein HanOQP8_Chr17g0681661 [Helianthus annuus]
MISICFDLLSNPLVLLHLHTINMVDGFNFVVWFFYLNVYYDDRATFVGLAYGYATILSSSLLVPMASHGINNLIGGIIWRLTHTNSQKTDVQ